MVTGKDHGWKKLAEADFAVQSPIPNVPVVDLLKDTYSLS